MTLEKDNVLKCETTRNNAKYCGWGIDGEYEGQDSTYYSACGSTFIFNDGDCIDNGFVYCPYCGNKIDSEKGVINE